MNNQTVMGKQLDARSMRLSGIQTNDYRIKSLFESCIYLFVGYSIAKNVFCFWNQHIFLLRKFGRYRRCCIVATHFFSSKIRRFSL